MKGLMKKMCHVHTVEYYAAFRMKVVFYREIKDALGGQRARHRDSCCLISHMHGIQHKEQSRAELWLPGSR